MARQASFTVGLERGPHRARQVAAALALLGGALLAVAPAARAQDVPLTPAMLVDRAQIEDLLTRYYYNLGHGSAGSFATYYADDAELVLGASRYKGKDGIEGAYKSLGATSPGRKAFSFNVSLSNPLIVVRGDRATAQLIFTEIVIDSEGTPPRLLAQGREYDDFVRIAGQWRFSRRQILPGAQIPAGWTG